MEVRRFRFAGRVQGVGFRWFVREQARALDVAGWVQNEAGGEVVLEVGGAAETIAQLLAIVRVGPPGARVDAVHEEPTESRFDSLARPFSVLR